MAFRTRNDASKPWVLRACMLLLLSSTLGSVAAQGHGLSRRLLQGSSGNMAQFGASIFIVRSSARPLRLFGWMGWDGVGLYGWSEDLGREAASLASAVKVVNYDL